MSLSEALSLSAPLMAGQLEDESLGHGRIRQGIFNTQLSPSSAIPPSPLPSRSLLVSLPPPPSVAVCHLFFLWLSFPGFDYSSRVWRVWRVCVCVCVSCICMAGALWIKEQKLLTLRCSSSDTRLQKYDNIENKLMNSQTHMPSARAHTHTRTHAHTSRPVLENIPG